MSAHVVVGPKPELLLTRRLGGLVWWTQPVEPCEIKVQSMCAAILFWNRKLMRSEVVVRFWLN